MQTMTVTIPFGVYRGDRTVEPNLDQHLGDVMDALIEIAAINPVIGGSLESGLVEVWVDVEAKNHAQAFERAFDVMCTAILAAGGRVTDLSGNPLGSQATSPTGEAVRWTKLEPIAW